MERVRGVTVGNSLGIDRYVWVILRCCDRLRQHSLGNGKVEAGKEGKKNRELSTIERRREKRKWNYLGGENGEKRGKREGKGKNERSTS